MPREERTTTCKRWYVIDYGGLAYGMGGGGVVGHSMDVAQLEPNMQAYFRSIFSSIIEGAAVLRVLWYVYSCYWSFKARCYTISSAI